MTDSESSKSESNKGDRLQPPSAFRMKLSVAAVAAVILATAIVADANTADAVDDRGNQCVDLNQLCPALKDRIEQLEERLNQVIELNPINPVVGPNSRPLHVPDFGNTIPYKRR